MLAAKMGGRRERTFIGTRCAVCEELLEHMLRGERILQMSCGHVAHEACFHEFVKEFQEQTCLQCQFPVDPKTKPGESFDLQNVNKFVHDAYAPDMRAPQDPDESPVPWDNQGIHVTHAFGDQTTSSPTRRRQKLPERIPPRASTSERHVIESNRVPRRASSNGKAEVQDGCQNIEVDPKHVSVGSSCHLKAHIPAPTVTIQSEFSTLNRSRQPQSLTCLVTVAVDDGHWQTFQNSTSVLSTLREKQNKSPRLSTSTHSTVRPLQQPVQVQDHLEQAKTDLMERVESWHGLEIARFGELILQGQVQVSKDCQTWQDLHCYLFSEMLICVKEKKTHTNDLHRGNVAGSSPTSLQKTRFSLKGSILIKKHLEKVDNTLGDDILTLTLSAVELPTIHLLFSDRRQLGTWRRAFANVYESEPVILWEPEHERDISSTDEEERRTRKEPSSSSLASSSTSARSQSTACTDYEAVRGAGQNVFLESSSLYAPLDIVVVIPISPSMHGPKMNLLRDMIRFLVSNLREHDRLGLVTFGSAGGAVQMIGMNDRSWHGWKGILDYVHSINYNNPRADAMDGANAAIDLLMQRQTSPALPYMLLVSDCPSLDLESVEFLVSRAQAAKVAIHCFGLSLTHQADTMVDISTRTRACYTFVKDWMMLRECLAGCLGALQSISHRNAKLRFRLPDGSPAKMVKISGALDIALCDSGREAEVSLGDLRFGDRRDVLVQLVVQADTSTPDHVVPDPWDSLISGLEAIGSTDAETRRAPSIEEVPLLLADLAWDEMVCKGGTSQLSQPSLLVLPMLTSTEMTKYRYGHYTTPLSPPHPSVVRRRMELLTSDMLTRALGLVSRGQNERAQHLLSETRSIIRGLGKGALPPPPPPPQLPPLPAPPPTSALPQTPPPTATIPQTTRPRDSTSSRFGTPLLPTTSHRMPCLIGPLSPFPPSSGVDKATLTALDSELESSLEWICHPALFRRDSRKAVLQAIGVISSQRSFTFRTPIESLCATRIPGVRQCAERNREWKSVGTEALVEVS